MENVERKLNCNVMTPDGSIYRGDIDLAIIPAYDGEMGFLYNHAPLIAELGIGEVRLRKGQETDYLVVEGGFVEVNNNEVSIFPLYAYKKEDLSKADLERELKRLTGLEKPTDYNEKKLIKDEIDRVKVKLKVASR